MNMTFGERLRELRKAKNLSQRDLAEQVGVDFTYLSKIENDRMPPPSTKTIKILATVLSADPDELTVLAGKLPEDLAEIMIQNPEAIKMFRSMVGDFRSKEDWKRLFNPTFDPPSQKE